MPNRLDLPPELLSLIEKREQEERRIQERRHEAKAAGDVTEPLAAEQEDRRAATDRRSAAHDRRANES